MSTNDSAPPPPRGRGGMSLYANLLNPDAASTISSAPITYSREQRDEAAAAAAQKQLNAATLRFQPTKRPQPSQKAKPKPNFARVAANAGVDIPSGPDADTTNAANRAPALKSTIADWTTNDDDAYDYEANIKRERGSRKKRKKQKEEKVVIQNWDDVYDPSRPNIYEHYKHSEEKYREIRDWKDKLYAHRFKDRRRSDDHSDESDYGKSSMPRNFAPPSDYAFAPPQSFDDNTAPPPPVESEYVPPPPPAVEVANDETGEEAYFRRMRMAGKLPPVETTDQPSPPPPPPPPPPQQAPPPSQPPAPPAGTISRAPVRYSLPTASAELPSNDSELEAALQPGQPDGGMGPDEDEDKDSADDKDAAPRSLRPGQKGFAERLLSKYGWTKGSGLGASGTGMVNPLRVQLEKRKKRSDAEGGGFVGPAGKGRIIAGKMGKPTKVDVGAEGEESEGFGALSEVVVLHGMVAGLDLDTELADGSLMQEIGEECAEKYGRVERVYIHRQALEPTGAPVFIKFTSQLSALRAVNALEGRIFNGNAIKARYFDAEAFEKGAFE